MGLGTQDLRCEAVCRSDGVGTSPVCMCMCLHNMCMDACISMYACACIDYYVASYRCTLTHVCVYIYALLCICIIHLDMFHSYNDKPP